MLSCFLFWDTLLEMEIFTCYNKENHCYKY